MREVLSSEAHPEKLSKKAIQKKLEALVGAPDGWFTPRLSELSEVIDYVLNGEEDEEFESYEEESPPPPAKGGAARRGGANTMSV